MKIIRTILKLSFYLLMGNFILFRTHFLGLETYKDYLDLKWIEITILLLFGIPAYWINLILFILISFVSIEILKFILNKEEKFESEKLDWQEFYFIANLVMFVYYFYDIFLILILGN